MSFSRTETVLEDANNLLHEHELAGHPVESYLAQYALICLCADMQQAVLDESQKKVSLLGIQEVENFISSASQNVFRSVKKSEIAGFLGRFGDNVKGAFNGFLEEKEGEVSIYSNAVDARHAIAHANGANKSLVEVARAVDAAKIIIEAVIFSLDSELILPDKTEGLPATGKEKRKKRGFGHFFRRLKY